MKKFFVAVLAVVLMMTMFVGSASAATKADLVNKIKNDSIIGNYEHIVNIVVNQMDNFNFTSDECDYLLAKFDEAKAIIEAAGGDKGSSAHSYDPVTIEQIVDIVADVVTTLGYTYEYLPSQNPLHTGDDVFRVYDADGIIVFEFDGDYVKHTGGEVASDNGKIMAGAALGGGVVVLALAVFFAVRSRKNLNETEA
ncbi:MAG: hypothetical protein IKU25_06085 [Clostridia bacterium]|nr:hypothetical protein [Clostridia bacterium]